VELGTKRRRRIAVWAEAENKTSDDRFPNRGAGLSRRNGGGKISVSVWGGVVAFGWGVGGGLLVGVGYRE